MYASVGEHGFAKISPRSLIPSASLRCRFEGAIRLFRFIVEPFFRQKRVNSSMTDACISHDLDPVC